ncbi:hypothetical protein CRE_22008 [Caenorhabditis remanei]|uniref:F-box domain-containing protein n=1 Tax=Caenorhabditis remanei TaxID=31234 RepID=E3N3C0_CAERE|nr:hypothetical protein CRE_22008 [Caenorhabditis remanei]
MSSPFPLLRLPRLVLFEVFKSLSIEEKIKLSFCSEKISTQINSARLYSQKVRVDLDISRKKIRVCSEHNTNIFGCVYIGISNDPDSQQYQIGGLPVPVIPYTKGINACWKNHPKGFISAIRHLLKMFKCKISTDISYYNSDVYQPMISELFDLQLEFKTLTIRPKGSKDQNLLFNQISSKFGLVEDLTISASFDRGFRPVFTSWPQKICIMRSDWFTLESLLTCTCTTITLKYSLLENKDWEVILMKWKTGGFPSLKRLTIDSLRFTNNGEEILGMNLMELNGEVIKTDDGSKKATIRIIGRNIEMSVTLSQ